MKNQKLAGTFTVQTVMEEGPQGPRGMLPFPSGEYSSSKTYVATSNIAPYVMFNGTYYVLNKPGSWLGTSAGKTPAQDYATNGVDAMWIPFEEFKAIYVELLFARFGLLGKAVFYDDYMFSQYGTDMNGNPTSDYSGFSSGTFTPNILLDFLKGEAKFANAILSGSIATPLKRIDFQSGTIDFSQGFNWWGYGVYLDDPITVYLPTDIKHLGIHCMIYCPHTMRPGSVNIIVKTQDDEYFANGGLREISISTAQLVTFIAMPKHTGEGVEWYWRR